MNDLLPSGRGPRLALVAGGGILATGLVVALIAQASHSAHLLDHLRHATPGWLVVCAAGEVIAYAGYLAGYRAMAQLDGGPRLPAAVALRVVALAFGAFALATAVGGLSVDFWALREAGEPPARASARVIAFETLRWAVLAIATWLAALAALLGLSRSVGPVLPVAWHGRGAGLLCRRPLGQRRPPARPSRFLGRARPQLDPTGLRRRGRRAGLPAYARFRPVGRAAPARARRQRRLLGRRRALRVGSTPDFGARSGSVRCCSAMPTARVRGPATSAGGAGGVDAAMTGGFVLAGAPLGAALLAAVTFRVSAYGCRRWSRCRRCSRPRPTRPSPRDRRRARSA